MRYIIDSQDSEGSIGATIAEWERKGKITIIEKADPVVEIKDKLEKVQRALETLKKAGWNREVMEIYISKKTGLSGQKIRAVMESQQSFFKAIGVKI